MAVELEKIVKAENPQATGLDIIFVHGITTAGLAPLSDIWKASLPKLAPANSNLWLWGYDVDHNVDDGLVWRALAQKANDLLEAVFKAYTPACQNPRPIVLVCHSLAGIVLKQMLWRASREHRFRSLLRDIISGIVFLATPHIVESDEAASRALSTILRSDLKPKSKRMFSKSDLSGLAFCGLQFEELKLDTPILSCYETLETRFQSPLWHSRKGVLVDSQLARISISSEKLIRIDTDLSGIFNQLNGVIHLQIKEFLQQIVKNAPERIRTTLNLGPTQQNSFLSSPPVDTALSSEGERQDASRRRGTSRVSFSSSPPISTPISTPISALHPPLRSESSGMSGMTLSSSAKSDGSYDSLSDFFPSRPHIRLPCYYIPRIYNKPNPVFCGRDDTMKQLDEALLPEDSSSGLKTFAICGPGGIGKTQVSVEYFHSKKEDFDAIFWIPAGSTEKLANTFSKISVSLGLEKKVDASDPVVSRELVKNWLEEPFEGTGSQGKRVTWMLIFDGADDPDILHDYWPQTQDGSILVTSRDPLMKTSVFSVNGGIELTSLYFEDAALLLRKLINLESKNPIVDETLLNIVKKLYCFPLAIVQMAGVIWRRSLKPVDFLDIYNHETERAELHSLRVGNQHNYPLTLSSTWALEGLSGGAGCLLSVISLLDADRIQEAIFTTNPTRGNLPGLPISKPSYSKELTELVKSSLVRRNKDEDEISVHAIVQDVVRGKLMSSPHQFTSAFMGTVNLLTTVWPYVSTPQLGYPAYDRMDRWDQCEKILPHIIRLKILFGLQTEEQKRECITSNFLWLLAEAAWYHLERSSPQECIDLVDATHEFHQYASEPMSDLLAEIHGTRGIVSMEINQPESALEHIQIHMDLRLESFHETNQVNSKLAAGYTELGRALTLNGLFARAREVFTKSIELRRQMPNFTRLQLFTPLKGLSLVAWHEGNNEQAAQLLLEALQDRELAFGGNDREGNRTGQILYHLGSVLQSQRNLQESFFYYQRALSQYRATVGDMHFYTANAAYKLGEHHFRFNDETGALKYLDQSLKVFSRGTYYAPDLARTQFLRSYVLNKLGRKVEAQEAASSAINIRRSLVPLDTRSFGELGQVDFDELVAFWFK